MELVHDNQLPYLKMVFTHLKSGQSAEILRRSELAGFMMVLRKMPIQYRPKFYDLRKVATRDEADYSFSISDDVRYFREISP